jgi:hypothetical protein
MNMQLIKALQDNVAPTIFGDTRVVFDGRKNLLSPLELNLGGVWREVCPSPPRIILLSHSQFDVGGAERPSTLL